MLNRYRTSKLNFREVIGAARTWERQGLEGDPRRDNYRKLLVTELADLLEFQAEHVRDREKLISIVGDLSIINVDELKQFGSVQQLQVEDLFVN